MLGIGPQVRVEPTELVSGARANGLTHGRFIGIKNHELAEKLFRFTQGVGSLTIA